MKTIYSTIHRLVSEERGVSVVLVAVMLVVLLGLGAMALDTGMLMWNRSALQNAVDGAALAGVRELPEDPTQARAVAANYLAANLPGMSDVTTAITITTHYNSNDFIEVSANRNVGPGMRAALNLGNINVPAVAKGIVAKSVPMCEVWPWAIMETVTTSGGATIPWDSSYGQEIRLKLVPGDMLTPGNFGAIDLPNGQNHGTSNYLDNIKHKGCLNSMTVDTKTGSMGQNNVKGVASDDDSVFKQCVPNFEYDHKATLNSAPDCVHWQGGGVPYSLGCPGNPTKCGLCTEPSGAEVQVPSCARVGIVPIVSGFKNGKSQLQIVNFAAFYLIGFEQSHSQEYIIGALLRKVTVSGGQPDYGQPLNGLRGYYLWQ